MKRILLPFLGAAMLASPVAPTGCETVNFGVAYQGNYGTYQVSRAVVGGHGRWDVLVTADGKRILPLHPSR